MIEYKIHTHFHAAHQLPEYDGDCQRIHGHTYRTVVYVRYDGPMGAAGIGVDFKALKKAIKHALPDHQMLNDRFDTTTAEALAPVITGCIEEALAGLVQDGQSLTVMCLELYETDDCAVIYRRAN